VIRASRETKILYFILLIAAVLAWFIQQELTPDELHGILARCYVFNILLAALIHVAMIGLKKRHVEKLGFVFLSGSGLKFLLFFLLIYPVFNADGHLSSMEFASFFIPYSLITIMETAALVRQLNRV
jgi:hypothetical protein